MFSKEQKKSDLKIEKKEFLKEALKNFIGNNFEMGNKLADIPSSQFIINIVNRYKDEISLDSLLEKRASTLVAAANVVIGDYTKAIKICNQIISVTPDDTMAYAIRGRAKHQANIQGAFADCQLAISLLQTNSYAYATLGVIKLKENNLEEALAHCNLALEFDSENYGALVIRSDVLVQQDKLSSALIDATKAVIINPRGYTCYLQRAKVNLNSKNFKEALVDINKAIEINPEDKQAYIVHGMATLSTIESCSQVITDIETLFLLCGNNIYSHAFSGRLFFILKNYEKALLHSNYAKVVDLKNSFSYETIIYTKMAQNDSNAAIQECQYYLSLKSKNYFFWALLGALVLEKNNPADAIKHCDASNNIKKNHFAYGIRARACLQLGNLNGANEDISIASSLKHEKHEEYVFATCGRIKLLLGDLNGAIEDSKKSVNGFLYPSYALETIARAECIRGDLDVAMDYCDQAIKLNNKSSHAYATLARIHLLNGKFELAIQRATQAINYDNKNEYAYVIRGKAYEETGKYKNGIQDYEQIIRITLDDNVKEIAKKEIEFLKCKQEKIPNVTDKEGISSTPEEEIYSQKILQDAFTTIESKQQNNSLTKDKTDFDKSVLDNNQYSFVDTEQMIKLSLDNFIKDKMSKINQLVDFPTCKFLINIIEKHIPQISLLPQAYTLLAAAKIVLSDLEGARTASNKAIELDSTFSPAYATRARANIDNTELANKDCKLALSYFHNNSYVFATLAQIELNYLDKNPLKVIDIQKTLQLCEESLSRDVNNYFALEIYCNALIKKHEKYNFTQIINRANKAIGINSQSHYAYYILAITNFDFGNYEEALKNANLALRISPGILPNMYYVRAISSLYCNADYTQAIADGYALMLIMEDTNFFSFIILADAYYFQQDYEEALFYANLAKELNHKDVKPYEIIAATNLVQGEYDAGISACKTAVLHCSSISPRLHALFAALELAKMNLSEVKTHTDIANEIDSNALTDAVAARGRILQGNLKEAAYLIDLSLKRVKRIDDKNYILETHARLKLLQNDLSGAIQDSIQAKTQGPVQSYAYETLALAKCLQTNLEEALIDSDAAIKLNKKSWHAYATRAHVQFTYGNYYNAVQEADTSIKYNEYYRNPYLARARAYHMLGKSVEAIKDYRKIIELSSDPKVKETFEKEMTKIIELQEKKSQDPINKKRTREQQKDDIKENTMDPQTQIDNPDTKITITL